MTWKLKVSRVVFALVVVGALALASGANWQEGWLDWLLAL